MLKDKIGEITNKISLKGEGASKPVIIDLQNQNYIICFRTLTFVLLFDIDANLDEKNFLNLDEKLLDKGDDIISELVKKEEKMEKEEKRILTIGAAVAIVVIIIL